MEDHSIALQDYLNAARKHKLAAKELHAATMALVEIVKKDALNNWFSEDVIAQLQDTSNG